MGFAKIYRNESPRTVAVKQQIGAYRPGTRNLQAPIQIYRGTNSTGSSQTNATTSVEKKRQPTNTAGLVAALRKKKAQTASKNTRTFAKKRQPSTLDDLMGCDELGCMLDDCSLEDSMEDEVGNVFEDAWNGIKSGAGWLVDAFDSLMNNPVFMAVMPVVALANSDVGMSVGAAVPGIGGVVSLGKSIKSWASDAGAKLPPQVASWASNAAAGLTSDIPPEVTQWAKSAIPQSAIAEAKKAGIDMSKITGAPSKGVTAGKFPSLLSSIVKKSNTMFGNLSSQIGAAVTAAKAGAPVPNALPAPAVVTPEVLALAAPVPMASASIATPTMNLTVSPLSGDMANIAAQLEQRIGGQLAQIQAQVKLRSLQDQATSEHRALVKDARWKRSLVSGLQQIASNTKRP